MAELHDELAVPLMHRGADAFPHRDEIVAMHGAVIGGDAPLEQHRHEGRDDRADAAFGELALPVDAGLAERAVLVVPAARNAGAENAILDGEIAKLERGEDDVTHDRFSASMAPSHTARYRAGT